MPVTGVTLQRLEGGESLSAVKALVRAAVGVAGDMQLLVSGQVILAAESLPTHVARPRPLVRVNANVISQVISPWEMATAVGAIAALHGRLDALLTESVREWRMSGRAAAGCLREGERLLLVSLTIGV